MACGIRIQKNAAGNAALDQRKSSRAETTDRRRKLKSLRIQKTVVHMHRDAGMQWSAATKKNLEAIGLVKEVRCFLYSGLRQSVQKDYTYDFSDLNRENGKA